MSPEMLALLAESLGETLYMVGVSAAISTLFGVPLGVVLVTTSRGHILENLLLNRVLGAILLPDGLLRVTQSGESRRSYQ